MKIYAGPSHQLGNSLRNTITMKILADYIGADFYVNGQCVNNLEHEKDREIMSCLFRKYLYFGPQYYKLFDERDIFNFKSYGTTTELIVEGDIKYIPDIDFAVYYHIYSIKHIDMSIDDYCINKINVYKSLEWPDFLINEVNNFNKKYELINLIGIHIRYTDNLTDTQKYNTRLDTFMEKLKTISTPILLCSDNQNVINTILNTQQMPNILLPNKIENYMYQSLYEMMLLSKTKKIIGSYASTFSYEAAFFIGTDIELYKNNEWKIYDLSKYNSI